jgi:hypothetical protein
LADGETYVLIANGIVSAEGYTPATPFDIYVYGMGREMASMTGNTDVLVFHGSTDAPTVDVVETGVGAGTIVDDLMYGDFAGYLELPTDDYELTIKDETGSVTVAVFEAPLATLGLYDAALVTVASGFLDPSMNSDGATFGLWVALPSGGELIELSITTSIEESFIANESVNVYPNPSSGIVNINYELKSASDVEVSVIDLTGSKIRNFDLGSKQDMAHNFTLDISDLNNGLYFVRIQASNSVITRRIQIVN